ncbi:MAG: DUF2577 domain-containing protein [Oscillospiraceae bacterium]|nr:DUF2577 domain-containing protein [Oscillospiraceae bacterium]
MNELVRLVKQAAVDAVRAEAPMGQCYGIVINTSPLKIQVDQKKILSEAQLILTDNVRDFNVVLSTIEGEGKSEGPHYTENESGGAGDAAFALHRHQYQGRKKWRVHNALEVDEKVTLLRCDGGQKYVVLDRWEARE